MLSREFFLYVSENYSFIFTKICLNLKEIILKGTITWSTLGQQINEAKEVYWLSYFFTMIHFCFSIPLSYFYPYGVSNGDTALPAGDDSSSGSISISVPFPFFNSNYNSLYVSKYA